MLKFFILIWIGYLAKKINRQKIYTVDSTVHLKSIGFGWESLPELTDEEENEV